MEEGERSLGIPSPIKSSSDTTLYTPALRRVKEVDNNIEKIHVL